MGCKAPFSTSLTGSVISFPSPVSLVEPTTSNLLPWVSALRSIFTILGLVSTQPQAPYFQLLFPFGRSVLALSCPRVRLVPVYSWVSVMYHLLGDHIFLDYSNHHVPCFVPHCLPFPISVTDLDGFCLPLGLNLPKQNGWLRRVQHLAQHREHSR